MVPWSPIKTSTVELPLVELSLVPPATTMQEIFSIRIIGIEKGEIRYECDW